MPKKEQRPLDPVYQDAESSYGGKFATIQRACIKTGAKRKWGEVLRWYLEHGAEEHPVESAKRSSRRPTSSAPANGPCKRPMRTGRSSRP